MSGDILTILLPRYFMDSQTKSTCNKRKSEVSVSSTLEDGENIVTVGEKCSSILQQTYPPVYYMGRMDCRGALQIPIYM